MTEQDLLFSLDIGTRTVVGIVGCHDGEKFIIHGFEVEEHKERAMYDGQVHDIERVAGAVKKVKERLESKLGLELKRVAIAAAGRSLKTCKVIVERDIDPTAEIDKELIGSLEIEGIQLAQKEIESMRHEEDLSYYCVGYAVVNYFLNGSVIGNPEGHKGKKLGMEVLSTFLPRVVVDSLYAVVSRAELEVASLTLEPIAAMNVSIHNNLRLLNIALVDIGAGTSDIALTKNGTVFAFAMAPVAGDEITEKLAESYLLDFDQAEKVKISLCRKQSVKYKDIMGITYERPTEEILKSVEPAVKMLAEEIGRRIIEYNGKAPSAVFLIGGGSQIPMLPELLAQELQLPIERVGVRKADIIRDVEIKNKKLSGPEFITPIGIAVTAYLNRQKDFLHITVNDINVKLFNSKSLTVADGLILVGFNPRRLIGRRGNSVTFTLNGRTETVKGDTGEPAQILLNGAKAGLDKAVFAGDRIQVEPAVDGKPAEVYIRDYLAGAGKTIFIDGKQKTVEPVVTVNGASAGPDTRISDGDEVVIRSLERAGDFAGIFDLDPERIELFVNGKKASPDTPVQNGAIIAYEVKTGNTGTGSSAQNEVGIFLNGKPLRMRSEKKQLIFVDVFNYIDINPSITKGNIKMLLNGNKAGYTDVISEGDRIEISW